MCESALGTTSTPPRAGLGSKAALAETVQSTDLPRLIVYVSRVLSQQTGCTMRTLRFARRLRAWRNGLAESHGLDDGSFVAAVRVLDARGVRHVRAP